LAPITAGRSADWRTRAAQAAATIGDSFFAARVVISGIIAWVPLAGIAAARESVAKRRYDRASLAAIDRTHGEVWARHARRCATNTDRLAARRSSSRVDW